MKNYNLELSSADFNKMAQELEAINTKIYKSRDLILQALAEYTKERIQYHISSTVGLTSYTPTNELLNSVDIKKIFEDTISIYTDNAYAKYVEYGTGIVGASNPHPEASEDGWQYGTKYGEEGWYYKNPKTGEVWWTKGQVAHRFMYNAFQDLKQNYMEIAKDVLRREGII